MLGFSELYTRFPDLRELVAIEDHWEQRREQTLLRQYGEYTPEILAKLIFGEFLELFVDVSRKQPTEAVLVEAADLVAITAKLPLYYSRLDKDVPDFRDHVKSFEKIHAHAHLSEKPIAQPLSDQEREAILVGLEDFVVQLTTSVAYMCGMKKSIKRIYDNGRQAFRTVQSALNFPGNYEYTGKFGEIGLLPDINRECIRTLMNPLIPAFCRNAEIPDEDALIDLVEVLGEVGTVFRGKGYRITDMAKGYYVEGGLIGSASSGEPIVAHNIGGKNTQHIPRTVEKGFVPYGKVKEARGQHPYRMFPETYEIYDQAVSERVGVALRAYTPQGRNQLEISQQLERDPGNTELLAAYARVATFSSKIPSYKNVEVDLR